MARSRNAEDYQKYNHVFLDDAQVEEDGVYASMQEIAFAAIASSKIEILYAKLRKYRHALVDLHDNSDYGPRPYVAFTQQELQILDLLTEI
jgi:hypothetical protein